MVRSFRLNIAATLWVHMHGHACLQVFFQRGYLGVAIGSSKLQCREHDYQLLWQDGQGRLQGEPRQLMI
jgi:hypothetical protein